MRIVIDARESGTSTGRYVDKLVEYLHKLMPAEQFVLLTKPDRVAAMHELAPSFEIISSPHKEFSFSEQTGFLSQLKSLGADLVHFGMTQQPVRYRGKSVTTIHDLTTARFSNPAKNKLAFKTKQAVYRRVIKRVAQKSSQLITPSQFVKDDVAQYTGVNPDKIEVTYEAADKILVQSEALTELKDKKFIMHVGRAQPHKNLRRLVDAFAAVQAKNPDLYLVFGGKNDANYEIIKNHVHQKKLDQVVFTGFISEGALRWLYENTAAYVFPSLSEGFGLPGLEAMVHGAPVLASNATCLPEIYGKAAHYFDPLDVADMAQKIDEVLSDNELKNKLITAGKLRAAKYSWQKMAEQTLEIYRSVLG